MPTHHRPLRTASPFMHRSSRQSLTPAAVPVAPGAARLGPAPPGQPAGGPPTAGPTSPSAERGPLRGGAGQPGSPGAESAGDPEGPAPESPARPAPVPIPVGSSSAGEPARRLPAPRGSAALQRRSPTAPRAWAPSTRWRSPQQQVDRRRMQPVSNLGGAVVQRLVTACCHPYLPSLPAPARSTARTDRLRLLRWAPDAITLKSLAMLTNPAGTDPRRRDDGP